MPNLQLRRHTFAAAAAPRIAFFLFVMLVVLAAACAAFAADPSQSQAGVPAAKAGNEDIPDSLKELQEKHKDDIALIQKIEKMGKEKDVTSLIAMLKDGNSVARMSAAAELGKLGDPRAVEPLIETLDALHPAVRSMAIDALGKLRDGRAVEPLVGLLDSWLYRDAAAKALEEIGEPSVTALIRVLKEGSVETRIAAAKVLGELRDPRALEPLRAIVKDPQATLPSFPRALPGFGASKKDIENLHREASKAFGKIEDKQAVGPLIERLRRNPDSDAAAELVRIRKPAVLPLIAVLKDGNMQVRMSAASVLGQIKDPRAVEPLLASCREEAMVDTASKALANINRQASPALARELKSEDRNVRRCAVHALAEIKDPATVDPLVAALADEDREVRGSAKEALRRIGEPAVWPLVGALRGQMPDDARQQAAILLGEIGDLRAVDALIAARQDRDAGVRQAAEKALTAVNRSARYEECSRHIYRVQFMPDADKLLIGHGCYNKPYSKGWAVYAFAGERIEDFSVLTRATTHRIKSSPAFSRDGKQIAFVSGHGTHRNIYVMNADGSNVRQLTHDYNENPQPAGKDLITMRFNGAPSFSPDGKRIIFKRSAVQRQKPKHHADPMEPSRWDIYEVEIATGRERRLTNFAFYGISEPFYLADGKRFIFSADFRTTHGPETGLTEKFHDTYRRNYGNNTIFIMDGEKNVLKPAFVNGNESSAPRVSSNDTILFTSTKKSKSRISYFYNEPFICRDGKIRQLGESHIGLFTHAISPDGSLILYRSDRWHIVDRDGKKLKEVSIFEGSLDWLEKQKFKSSGSMPTAAKATGRSN